MRLYYTGASPDNLRKARQHAPSHTHGAGWTPQKMTPHDVPYFVDNGAYTGSFDMHEWRVAIQKAKEMPRWPDFIVLPDVYNDAEATRDLIEESRYGKRPSALELGPWRCDMDRYVVFQPGLPLDEQFRTARCANASGVFVGGDNRWQRAFGEEIVERAHADGKKAHLGNPGGADGLVWAYRSGFDSCDTTSVFQNQYWHWLAELEAATEETHSPRCTDEQRTLKGWSA